MCRRMCMCIRVCTWCVNVYLNNTLQTTKNNVATSLVLSARYE